MKTYNLEYDFGRASAKFEIDTNNFTNEDAKELLGFFNFNYNEYNEDVVLEYLKHLFIEAIKSATFNNYNLYGVVSYFDCKEGFPKLDGSSGIKLVCIEEYEFDTDEITIT